MAKDRRCLSTESDEATAVDRTGVALDRGGLALATTVETTRMLPTSRAVFEHAKIVFVMEGLVDVETVGGTHLLHPGMSLVLGSRRWCRVRPLPSVRTWTLYVNEEFLRTQSNWLLPHRDRVISGVHLRDWDGAPRVLHLGLSALRALEPIWRQMSLLRDEATPPEIVAVRTVELFARAAEQALPVLLAPHERSASPAGQQMPISGRLTEPELVGHVGRAIRLLRERMAEPWTVLRLAAAVSVSRTHLTRLFVTHTGAAPMVYLRELRLTEFTRLLEESDLSVASAAAQVGWTDARVASAWFRRRFGTTPSRYRSAPHPSCSESTSR